MKFLLRRPKKQTDFGTILFVSEDNDERSQIAEGFFRKYAPRGYFASSAGTGQSAFAINPLAQIAMREYGIDIINQKRKMITNQMILNANMIVNIGNIHSDNSTSCVQMKWHIENVTDKDIEGVRKIRDEIEMKVRRLAADLNKKNL